MLPVQPVREVLYKKEFAKYDNVEYKNCSPIDYLTRIKNDDRDDTLSDDDSDDDKDESEYYLEAE